MRPTDQDTQWHLDKRVPLPMLAVGLVQTLAIVWWAASASERLSALEKRVEAAAPQTERLVRVETMMVALSDSLKEVKALLQKTAPP